VRSVVTFHYFMQCSQCTEGTESGLPQRQMNHDLIIVKWAVLPSAFKREAVL